MKKQKFMVSIACSWIEEISAESIEEAIKKAEKSYRYGKGRFPREYVEATNAYDEWCQVED